MNDSRGASFDQARFVSLVTFRRDGREVATPVWFVTAEGKYYAYTKEDAGKVKRIRATGKVKVAPCKMNGTVTGPWREGHGRVVDDPEIVQATYALLSRKYGWIYQSTTAIARLTGRFHRRAVLEWKFAEMP